MNTRMRIERMLIPKKKIHIGFRIHGVSDISVVVLNTVHPI